MVTARVPSEIRRQGNAVLKEIGATPTQLVNAAYEYVLARHGLPKAADKPESCASAGEQGTVTRRTLDPVAAHELATSIERSTLAIPESFWAGRTYKEILAEGRCADYEALA